MKFSINLEKTSYVRVGSLKFSKENPTIEVDKEQLKRNQSFISSALSMEYIKKGENEAPKEPEKPQEEPQSQKEESKEPEKSGFSFNPFKKKD